MEEKRKLFTPNSIKKSIFLLFSLLISGLLIFRSFVFGEDNRSRLIAILCISLFAVIVSLLVSTNYFRGEKVEEDSPTQGKKIRDSNFELLRLVGMLFIIGHHFAVHGGLLGQPAGSAARIVGLIFLPLGKTFFITYIAISMWFLADPRKTNLNRFLKVWLEVFFYSIVFTIVTYSMTKEQRFIDFLSSMFVMIGNSHGFAASYLIFIFLLPFLQMATRNLTKAQGRLLLVVLFMLQVGAQILNKYTGYIQPVFSEPLLFIFCYVLSINLKRWPVKIVENVIFEACLLALCMGLLYWAVLYAYNGGQYNYFYQLISILSSDESSVIYITAGYMIFFLVKKVNIGYHKTINFLASSSFAVLLIHDHNFFRHLFWYNVVKVESFFDSNLFVLHFFFTIVAIYFACSTIEYLRKEFVERPFFSLPCIQKLINKYNNEVFKDC